MTPLMMHTPRRTRRQQQRFYGTSEGHGGWIGIQGESLGPGIDPVIFDLAIGSNNYGAARGFMAFHHGLAHRDSALALKVMWP